MVSLPAHCLQEEGHHVIPYVWKRKADTDPLIEEVSDIVWAEDDPDYLLLQSWVPQSAVIVDALLGTGNVRAIGGSLATLLETVRTALEQQAVTQPTRIDPTRPAVPHSPLVIACDCPSGLRCDTGEIDPLALPADVTVTFALPKRGHFLQPGATACGRLVIADINIDRNLAPSDAPDILTPADISAMLPARPASAHKGTFGKALIVAGSANYPGAAAIACTAAYRAGAGLAHLAAPAYVCQVVASQVPEPVHTVLPSDLGAITQAAVSVLTPLLPNHQGMLVGPGLGTDTKTVEFVETLLVGRTQVAHPIGFLSQRAVEPEQRPELPPLVVDADGLNALAQLDGGPASLPANSILTPHPGEMARLTGSVNQRNQRAALASRGPFRCRVESDCCTQRRIYRYRASCRCDCYQPLCGCGSGYGRFRRCTGGGYGRFAGTGTLHMGCSPRRRLPAWFGRTPRRCASWPCPAGF